MNFSLEIGPHTDLQTLPPVKDVYVTMLPGGDYKETADKSGDLVKKGFNPVPHFPARSINNEEELKDFKEDKNLVMYCTGGIRCEKASSYMISEGFEEVYHLEGGILKYLEEVKAEESLWTGECFVFDDRGAVSSSLDPSEGFWVEDGQTAKGVSYNK